MKKLLISTLAASIVYFLLGWLFYGIMFANIYANNNQEENLLLVYLGCLVYSFFLALILVQWVNVVSMTKGAVMAAVVGFLTTLQMNLFMYSNMPMNLTNVILDIIISTVMSFIVGFILIFTANKCR